MVSSPLDNENAETIDICDFIDILTRLQLPIIPQDYVDQVVSSHYSYYTFPESYESIVMEDIDFQSIMNESCELLNTYLQQPSIEILWDQFIDDETCSVQPLPLVCLLNCYIQNGIKDMSDNSIRTNGLSATRLFFLASTFSGSSNIGFYHTYILTKCSELIKACIGMLRNTDTNGDENQLVESEMLALMGDLMSITRDIRIMVTRFKFFEEIGSLDLIVDMLVDITRLERTSGNILEQVPTGSASFGTLAVNAYTCLMHIFNENCGKTYNIGQKLVHSILPGLLVDEQRELQLTTRQFNAIRDHHLKFIRKITTKLGPSKEFESILEILLQHLLSRGPDRSELKPRQFQIILEVWRLCPNNVRIKMKYNLLQMVYDVDAKLRTVALETLFKLLSEPEEMEPEDPELLPFMPTTKHEFIVAVILSKFQDILLTVRSKAFSLFAALTANPSNATSHHIALAKRVLVDPYLKVDNLNHTSFSKKDFHEFHQYLANDMANFDSNNISNFKIFPGAKILLWVLNVHARDERAHIRRLSLTLLCNLFLINKKFMEKYYLALLVNSCSDCSVTIRKVVVSGLTDLMLQYPDNQEVLNYWFKGLIHLVGDRDKKLQELAVECMSRVILDNIKPYSVQLINDNNPLDYLPWRVLSNALNEEVGKYMMCLCEKWRLGGFLTDHIVKDVMTYVGSSNHEWTVHSLYLLQLISHQITIKNMNPVIKYFDTHFDSWFICEDPDLNTLLTRAQMTIEILFLNHDRLDKDTRCRFLDTFDNLLFNFKVPIRLISKSLDLYTVLLSDDPDKLNTNLKNIFNTICNTIETSTNMDSEDIMIRHICMLGDIGLVQHLKIKNTLKKYLLSFLDETNKSASPAFKTIVILTIGKLSIVDEQLAKEAIVRYGRILKNPCHPSIKINALTALADLCLRCTTLVEQAIPEMCICLKADSVKVKRVALQLLTGLILEDYIKLRDVVFFALLSMLEDSDSQVRQETSSFIVNYLLIKNKNIMERKLIEVIFNFNGYTGITDNGLDNCFTNPELKAFFSMESDSKKASRHYVYRFMLIHMMDENKLKLMVKIFNIFEEVVKEVGEITSNEIKERAIQTIKDAFWILRAKEMGLTSGRPRDNNNDDDPGTLEKVADLAKKQVVLETYKMVMTDYIIPGILKLKYELTKTKVIQHVRNDLHLYLSALTSGKSPIKAEIINLLSDDHELMTEILYQNNRDLKNPQSDNDNGNGVNESDDDDDDEDEDENGRFIDDLEYVTWAQMMRFRDQAEESSHEASVPPEIQDDVQQQALDIQEDVESEAASNFSQLTGKVSNRSRKSKSIEERVTPKKFKQMKISENNEETVPSEIQEVIQQQALEISLVQKHEQSEATANISKLNSKVSNRSKRRESIEKSVTPKKQINKSKNNDETPMDVDKQAPNAKSVQDDTDLDDDDLPAYRFFK